MRVKRTNVIYTLTFLTWLSILYITITYRQINQNPLNQNGGNFDSRIVRLEYGISDQFQKNNELINDAQKVLEMKKRKDPGMKREQEENNVKIPVLVFACNRITVTKCLDKLIEYRPDPDRFPIIVSQDCDHEETKQVILNYGSQVSLIRQPDQSDIQVPPKEKKFKGYFKIARHYGWALNQMFFNFNFSTAIIVEDDLEISVDFYEYFLGTNQLLQKDPSLWCVSAWNDNGKEGLVNMQRPDLLYRTDFFPGLGWMLTKNLWSELYKKWPRAYWDDWIRDPAQRKGRSCIRPEISRTRTFGKIGVSNGMFYEKHLKYIKLNEEYVPFTKLNLTYLLKENYDNDFVKRVHSTPLVNLQDLKDDKILVNPARILYRTREEFRLISKKLGLMDDFKSGVPRTAYKGIVTFFYKERTVHLAPNVNWKGYDVTWT